MKKFTLILLICAVAALALCGCQPQTLPEVPAEVSLYVPDGAPALSVANILADKQIGSTTVDVNIAAAGSEVVAKCTNGEADMAILPTTAAATVLSKNTDYCLFSNNVRGVLYVVGTEQVSELSGLVGQVVYSIGLGDTPEKLFKKILDDKNIPYCELGKTVDSQKINFVYASDASSIIPIFGTEVKHGDETITVKHAVLGEPAVTKLTKKAAAGGSVVYNNFDLQNLWQQTTGNSENGYPQACLIVKRSLLTESFASALQNKLQDNNQYLLQNTSGLKQVLTDCGSANALDYTEEILARCNLTFILASTIKAEINDYLAYFDKSLPDSAFYDAK